MAKAARHNGTQQPGLYDKGPRRARPRAVPRRPVEQPGLCAACRAGEARYGFRVDGDDPLTERPRTLCFECFRMAIDRRQRAVTRLVQDQNEQRLMPLEARLEALSLRRRRAQIAARKALETVESPTR